MKTKYFVLLCLFVQQIALAQPKITINTESPKAVELAPGETLTMDLLVGNYGDQAIDSQYKITINGYSSEGFFGNNPQRLEGLVLEGIPLDINEQRTIPVEYTLPADAPEARFTFSFYARSDVQRINSSSLFVSVNVLYPVALPDLKVVNVLSNQSNPEVYHAQFEVENKGRAAAAASQVSIYLTETVGLIDEESILWDVAAVPALAVGEHFSYDQVLTFEGIEAGAYHVLIQSDSDAVVAENDEYNNIYSTYQNVTIAPKPDISVSSILGYNSISVYEDATKYIINDYSWETKSESSAITASFRSVLYFSSDEILDDKDIIIAEDYIEMLDSGATVETKIGYEEVCENGSYTVCRQFFPFHAPTPGEYYFIYVADVDNLISEASETNNMTVDLVNVDMTGFDSLQVLAAQVDDTNVLVGTAVEVEVTIKNSSKEDYVGGDSLFFYQRVIDAGVNCDFYSVPCEYNQPKKISDGAVIPSIAANTSETFRLRFNISPSFGKNSNNYNSSGAFETYLGSSDFGFAVRSFMIYLANGIAVDLNPVFPELDLSVELFTADSTFTVDNPYIAAQGLVKNNSEEDAYNVEINFGTYSTYDPNFVLRNLSSEQGVSCGGFTEYQLDGFVVLCIDKLAAGESAAFDIEYGFYYGNNSIPRPFSTGRITANSVTGNFTDPNLDNNRASLEFSFQDELGLELTASDSTYDDTGIFSATATVVHNLYEYVLDDVRITLDSYDPNAPFYFQPTLANSENYSLEMLVDADGIVTPYIDIDYMYADDEVELMLQYEAKGDLSLLPTSTTVNIEGYNDGVQMNSTSLVFSKRASSPSLQAFSSMNSLSTASLKVYPNPVSKAALELRFSEDATQHIQLYNTLGIKVLEQVVTGASTTLNLAGIPKGIYYLQVKVGIQFYTEEVIRL